jgi:hypothetical protein
MSAHSASLERLEISLWPEYDQPSMLVLLKGFLPPDAVLPATVSLPIPETVGTPSAVAYRDPQGGLMVAQHTFDIAGDQVLVAITTPTREVRLEYYDELDIDGAIKRYTYKWPGGIDIGRAVFEVMQPPTAVDFAVEPSVQPMRANDGLDYWRGDLGAIGPGNPFAIKVTYSKATPELTVAATTPPAATLPTIAPVPEPSPASTNGERPAGGPSTWWLLAVVLVVGLIGGYFLARMDKAGKDR